ncbi:hypothetical protein [Ulvibacterium marinum]|uniref:Glutaminyl-tRNA synthetase n=1 Tax=Ulvibacterium marinum TaxID=2419782 RepID=A0A3B0C034_9FLAO|nr:hypothetical protein [Ulvibacterium marinum]RKN78710.1 hypothetical protein D7Z94_21180 [Ulvibacterium marinum]
MNRYQSFEDIKYNLKRLSLERQIALEQMKGLKHEVEEDLGPYQWLQTAVGAIKKFGALYFIKKLVK